MLETKTAFDEWMQQRQIAWRNEAKNRVDPGDGEQNGRRYPWILQSAKWEQSLWPGIRSGTANSLPKYLSDSQIQPHQGKHNLKSSWVLCANLYFPFGNTKEGRALLAGFLREHVAPQVNTVDELHLEFAEEGDLDPSNLLGETGGKRGSGQTSPDLAFHVNGGKGLILIESKLTEHSFYPCSARRTTDREDRLGNPNPARCMDVHAVLANPQAQCHQGSRTWGRKYWDILRPVMNENAMNALKFCPATRAGYQLFRQQALAEGIARSGKYDFVYSCVAFDDRNEALQNCLKKTGIDDLESGWAALFSGKAQFKIFPHQKWVLWVRDHGEPSQWRSWLEYVTERYGFPL
jgi:hypothetical protein